MKQLFLEIQTYSNEDISRIGIYRYSELPYTHALLLGYRMDNGPIRVVDLAHGERIPDQVLNALADSQIIKYAFDASFVRVFLARYLRLPVGMYFPAAQWRCLKSWLAYLNLPPELEMTEDITNVNSLSFREAREIARKFCTAGRGETYRDFMDRMPADGIKWAVLKQYVVETLALDGNLLAFLENYPMPAEEWACYALNEDINDRGVCVDIEFVKKAIDCDRKCRKEYLDCFEAITGLSYPCADEFQRWLEAHGVATDSLSQAALKHHRHSATPEVQKALTLWRCLTMTSTQKYHSIAKAFCNDGRLRGLFSFCGGRNGRFGNLILRTDNLPTCRLSAMEEIRDSVLAGEYDDFIRRCCSPADAMAELLSTSFVPEAGKSLFVTEYLSLASSVLLWLAKTGTSADEYGDTPEEITDGLAMDINHALGICLKDGVPCTVNGIKFIPDPCDLRIQLPSGRVLTYYNALPDSGPDEPLITFSFDGMGEKNRWRTQTGNVEKVMMDILQGIARDVTTSAMAALESEGFHIVMHHPGALIVENPDVNALGRICDIVRKSPSWADKLNLSIRAYRCSRYLEKTMDTARKN